MTPYKQPGVGVVQTPGNILEGIIFDALRP
jgi:hypothetical protein